MLSVRTELPKIRSSLGVCPQVRSSLLPLLLPPVPSRAFALADNRSGYFSQHDCLYAMLSVKEHLVMYSKIKGTALFPSDSLDSILTLRVPFLMISMDGG